MVSSASAGTVGHAEGQGLQRDAHPTQGQGESRVLACGSSTLAAQKSQGPLSTHLSGSQPRSWAAEHWPVRPSFMATGSPPAPGIGRRSQVAAWGEVPRVLHPSPVESPPLSRPQATPKLTLSFKQENFLPESYRPYLCKHSEKTPLAFLVKGVSLPAQWSI